MALPSMLQLPLQALRWGYDAVAPKLKRRSPSGILRSEDAELNTSQRKQLLSSARDIHRNYVTAGWMIRKHLDYVTTFRFQGRSRDKQLNDKLQRLMAAWSTARSCDIAARHPLRRFLRLLEARAALDGDVWVNRLSSGSLQAIEGDRVRTPIGGLPDGITAGDLTHGVLTTEYGRNLKVCVCRRGRTSDFSPNAGTFTFETLLDASHVWQHGYFDRFDQVRGISPLSAALNNLQDSYEGIDYALARSKLEQLLTLAIFKADPNATLDGDDPQDYSGTIKLGGLGILQLDAGDRAEFLKGTNPSNEFQAFQTLVTSLTLKALDLPYSFFNESFTNYSGARQALLQYEQSASNRRADIVEFLDWLTAWRIALWALDGQLTFAEAEAANWEWVHAALPWLDPLKESQADIANLSAGLTTRKRLLKARGEEWDDVVTELADEQRRLQELGLPTSVQPDNALIKEFVTNGQ